ncbi:MAG: hypothetical protein ACT4R6_01030 [Gemmatimonadaceae bacterium]
MPTPTPLSTRSQGTNVVHSLVGEYLEEVQRDREAAARVPPPPRAWRRILALAVIAAGVAVWLIPSLGAVPAVPPTSQQVDAGARMTLFFASQRVREFALTRGRLPATLHEAGVSDSQISYKTTRDDEYTLSLDVGGKRIELPSSAADSAYIRDAVRTLNGDTAQEGKAN